MRVVLIVTVVALGLPLGGCFNLLPPKPLPDWAMNPQAQTNEAAPAREKTARVARERARRSVEVGALTSDSTREASGYSATDTLKPYTPEWQAREDAADARLRRQMNICNGC